MAEISELKTGQGNINVSGTVKEMGEERSFNKYGKQLSVVNAILEDDSGNIKLTLWNDDTKRIKQGDKIEITNGYVNEFQGEKQLTSGKFGQIKKIDAEGSGEDMSKADSEGEESVSEEVVEEEF